MKPPKERAAGPIPDASGLYGKLGTRRIHREPLKIAGPGMVPLRTTFQKSEIRTFRGLAFSGKLQSSPLRDDFPGPPRTPHPGAKNPQRESVTADP